MEGRFERFFTKINRMVAMLENKRVRIMRIVKDIPIINTSFKVSDFGLMPV